MYYALTPNGFMPVTEQDIRDAFLRGDCTRYHYPRDGYSGTSLSICGEVEDTRGECHSAWEEVWPGKPVPSIGVALQIARTST